jgi:hypothetical protein
VFCANNPVNFIDPFGERVELQDWLHWDVLGAAGWGASEGAAAALDGIIPFADPFEAAYTDECGNTKNGTEYSRALGQFSRDVYIMSLGVRKAGTLKFDGRSGTRKFQVRDGRTGKPYFRVDKGPVPGKGDNLWHYHRRPDLRLHRPYEGL